MTIIKVQKCWIAYIKLDLVQHKYLIGNQNLKNFLLFWQHVTNICVRFFFKCKITKNHFGTQIGFALPPTPILFIPTYGAKFNCIFLSNIWSRLFWNKDWHKKLFIISYWFYITVIKWNHIFIYIIRYQIHSNITPIT